MTDPHVDESIERVKEHDPTFPARFAGHGPDDAALERGHEGIEANVKRIAIGAAALLALVAVALGLMAWLVGLFEERERWTGEGLPMTDVVDRRLGEADVQTDVEPNQALEAARQREQRERVLDGYGWSRPAENVARIPIDRAIEIVGERGWKPWGGTEPEEEAEAVRERPEEASDE